MDVFIGSNINYRIHAMSIFQSIYIVNTSFYRRFGVAGCHINCYTFLMKIYFAAHATTKDNEAKVASGWSDTELSYLGHRATQYGLDALSGKTLEELLSTPFRWQPYWEYQI